MYVVGFASGEPMVLRIADSGGGTSGTELDLLREAQVYRALADSDIIMPRLHGIRGDGSAMLLSCVRGTHDLTQCSATERAIISDEYVACLSMLHRQDADALDIPRLLRPENPRDHALNELDLWARLREAKVLRPLPLVDCAFTIMRQNAPEYQGPLALCHGDVGPGNFMFADGQITALIDWELAHFGDPMDDLAAWIFRGHEWGSTAGGVSGGDLRQQLSTWSDLTGQPIGPDRLRFYRVMVLLKFYILGVSILDTGSEAQDRLPPLRTLPALDMKLAQGLLQLVGAPVGPPEPPIFAAASIASDAAGILRRNLEEVILPSVSDDEIIRRVRTAAEIAQHLALVDQFGPAIHTETMLDLTKVLGFAPPTVAQGELALGQLAIGSQADALKVVRYFVRRGARQATLWPAVAERAFIALPDITDLF